MNDFGGMISFVPKGSNYHSAVSMMEKLKIFTIAEFVQYVCQGSQHVLFRDNMQVFANREIESLVNIIQLPYCRSSRTDCMLLLA